MRHLSLAVVGVDFPNPPRAPTRRFAIEVLRPGNAVVLQPEPKNPADPHAVAVFNTAGVQLGYLTAERAPMIGKFIAAARDMETVFQHRTNFGCVIRLALDGEPMEFADAVDGDREAMIERDEFDQREWDD